MAEPSPSNFISLLWRLSLALLVATLVLDFAVNTLRCAWPWIVGVGVAIEVVALIIRRFRNHSSGW